MTDREIELEKQVAMLAERGKARDMEIRDLKRYVAQTNKALDRVADQMAALTLQVQPMLNSAAKLDQLLTEADRMDGMKTLAKQVVGWGFLGALGAAIAGIYRYFMGAGL